MLEVLIIILFVAVFFDTGVRIWHAHQYKKNANKSYEANLKSVQAFRDMYHEAMVEFADKLNDSVHRIIKEIEKYYESEN